jgi:hypothetical protein
MAGKMGALGLLYHEGGPALAATAAGRDEVARAAGDLFMAASWALDAWGWNLLRAIVSADPAGPAIVDPGRLAAEAELAGRLAATAAEPEARDADAAHFEYLANNRLLAATAAMAMTCGAAEAMSRGGERVDGRAVAESLVAALASVQAVLAATGVPLSAALEAVVAGMDGLGRTRRGGDAT